MRGCLQLDCFSRHRREVSGCFSGFIWYIGAGWKQDVQVQWRTPSKETPAHFPVIIQLSPLSHCIARELSHSAAAIDRQRERMRSGLVAKPSRSLPFTDLFNNFLKTDIMRSLRGSAYVYRNETWRPCLRLSSAIGWTFRWSF